MRTVVRALLPLCLASLPCAAREPSPPLLRGVDAIGVPGVPGPLTVAGPDAFAVVAAESESGPVAIVAAAAWGKGRVVAFGHGGYLGGVLETGDTARLLRNAVAWAARKKKKPRVATEQCPHVRRGPGAEPHGGRDPRSFDVVVTARPREAFRDYVRRGGGLVTAGLGWGWRQLNPGKDLATEHPGNRLLAEAGIVWADGTIRVPPDRRIAVAPPPPSVHAGWALDHGKGAAPAIATLVRAVASLPPGDRHLLPRLSRARGPGLDRVRLALQIHRDRRLPPDEIRAHPLAAEFPGAVPDSAPRVKREIEIDTAVPGRHSTGLYAAPGEVVTVEGGEGLELRIGAHTDRLWHKKRWRRAPEITRVFPASRGACAFGGLVYIEVPRNCGRGRVLLEIDGAVEAPYFVLGETDPVRWRESIRDRPAPWAELAARKVVLTLPADVVRKLDDPTELLEFWDRVLDACADLAAHPRERERPERYVADIQISAGYMHAGYPIMTHLDAAPRFVDLAALRAKGDWGMFHEMGHNHQSRDWTFDGAGEVTCNLFTLYVLDTVCTGAKGHQATSPEATRKWIEEYDRDFATWKRKPFLALVMYRQLQEAFGWEAYKKVFAEYRALPQKERPKSDAERRDQWMVRFSRAVGRDLGPFFESWGVPTSAEARASIANLEAWMPAAGGARVSR